MVLKKTKTKLGKSKRTQKRLVKSKRTKKSQKGGKAGRIVKINNKGGSYLNTQPNISNNPQTLNLGNISDTSSTDTQNFNNTNQIEQIYKNLPQKGNNTTYVNFPFKKIPDNIYENSAQFSPPNLERYNKKQEHNNTYMQMIDTTEPNYEHVLKRNPKNNLPDLPKSKIINKRPKPPVLMAKATNIINSNSSKPLTNENRTQKIKKLFNNMMKSTNNNLNKYFPENEAIYETLPEPLQLTPKHPNNTFGFNDEHQYDNLVEYVRSNGNIKKQTNNEGYNSDV